MAKKKKNVFTKLSRMIESSETISLKNLIIFQDTDGSYQLFDKYTIQKLSQNEYQVTSVTSNICHLFNSLKNATVWCIFDKRDKFYEAQRILELDNKLGSLGVDIHIHLSMYRKAKTTEEQLIHVAKLNEDRLRKKIISEELASYTADANYWQSKRFELKAA